MSKAISLTKGYSAIVDDELFETLSQYKWQAHKGRNGEVYATRYPRNKVTGIRTLIKMHNVVFGAAKGILIDHKNGNSLDNRRDNLRICTKAQNKMNAKKKKIGKCKFKGVYPFIKGRFGARITFNGKLICLGGFPTQVEAARAYNSAALKYHGEFARLNEI